MVDEETMQKIIAVGLLLLMGGVWFIHHNQSNMIEIFEENDNCGSVIDIIYEQCSEEGNINLTTMYGHDKTLTYDRGVCTIK